MNTLTAKKNEEEIRDKLNEFLIKQKKNKIHFYSADVKASHIIAYGDISGKRAFKITYHDSKYFAWAMKGRSYQAIGEAPSLEVAQDICSIYLD